MVDILIPSRGTLLDMGTPEEQTSNDTKEAIGARLLQMCQVAVNTTPCDILIGLPPPSRLQVEPPLPELLLKF